MLLEVCYKRVDESKVFIDVAAFPQDVTNESGIEEFSLLASVDELSHTIGSQSSTAASLDARHNLTSQIEHIHWG